MTMAGVAEFFAQMKSDPATGTLTHFQIQCLLAVWGSETLLSVSTIARLLGVDKRRVSAVCLELEEAGLVVRQRKTEGDKRHTFVALTSKGRDVCDRLACMYRSR